MAAPTMTNSPRRRHAAAAAGSMSAAHARGSRGIAEAALDSAGWPWSRRISLWLDALVMIEERAGSA
jgi:hypothetical protein